MSLIINSHVNKTENQDFEKKGKERFLQRGLWYNGKNQRFVSDSRYLRITSVKGDKSTQIFGVSAFTFMKQIAINFFKDLRSRIMYSWAFSSVWHLVHLK